jgi:hypothetical protein
MATDKEIKDLVDRLDAAEKILNEVRQGLKALQSGGGLNVIPKPLNPVPPISGSCT